MFKLFVPVAVVALLIVGGWTIYNSAQLSPDSGASALITLLKRQPLRITGHSTSTASSTAVDCESKFTAPVGGETGAIGTPRTISWKIADANANYNMSLELVNKDNLKVGNITDMKIVGATAVNSIQWNEKNLFAMDPYGTLKTSPAQLQPGNYRLKLSYKYTGDYKGTCAKEGSFMSAPFTITKY
jgi:hypothetical protein